MSTTEALLRDIADFCEEFGINEKTFGRRVVSDGKFVERVRRGGGLTVANLDRVRAYMAEERTKAGKSRNNVIETGEVASKGAETFPADKAA